MSQEKATTAMVSSELDNVTKYKSSRDHDKSELVLQPPNTAQDSASVKQTRKLFQTHSVDLPNQALGAYRRRDNSLCSTLNDPINVASMSNGLTELHESKWHKHQQPNHLATQPKILSSGLSRGKLRSSANSKGFGSELKAETIPANSVESISSKVSSISSGSLIDEQPASSPSPCSPQDDRLAGRPENSAYRTIGTRMVPPPRLDAKQNHLMLTVGAESFEDVKEVNTREQNIGNGNDQNGGGEAPRDFEKPTILPLPSGQDLGTTAEQKQLRSNYRKPPFMFAGILGTVLSSIFFSISILCLKLLPPNEGIQGKLKGIVFRGFIISSLCGISTIISRASLRIGRDELWVNFFRSIFGSAALMCSYISLEFISMGDSTALVFSSPIWTYIVSHFVFKEPLHWILLITLPASMFGIVLIAHPSLILNMDHLSLLHHMVLKSKSNSTDLGTSPGLPSRGLDELDDLYEQHMTARWPGVVIALVGSIFVTFSLIVMKFRKKTPIQTTTFWFGITLMIVGSIPLALLGGSELPVDSMEWLLLIGNGIFSWLGQTCLQWATQYESAGVMSILRTLDVLLSFVLSAVFLDEDIYLTSIIGSTIISIVIATIMLQSWIHQSQSCGKMRRNSGQVQAQQNNLENGHRNGSLEKEPYSSIQST